MTLHTEQQLIIVPWSSVKYLEAASIPAAALPFETIKGARILTSEENVSK